MLKKKIHYSQSLKSNSKLDKELQEWEVESTKSGAHGGGG
jgi:hypothetical protein